MSDKATDRARSLRRESTRAELRLWRLLRRRRLHGFKFRRQHPCPPFVLDLYCHEARLAIEVDGGQHNEPEPQRQDTARSDFLARKGITILRFWNHEVLQQEQAVLERVEQALTPTLSQRERGPEDRSAEGAVVHRDSGATVHRQKPAVVRPRRGTVAEPIG